MSPFELDRHVHRDLRRLPPPQAPSTLLPRILAARARLDARPWYARPLSTWPLGWRVASAAASAVLVLVASITLSAYYAEMSAWVGEGVGAFGRQLGNRMPGVRAGVVTAQVFWSAFVRPLAGYAAVLLLVMWSACAAFGLVLARIAFGEVSRS